MRIEQPQFFIYGVLLLSFIWIFSKGLPSAKLKLHLRAIAFAFGLGFIIVPGHGEFIIAPVLTGFTLPLRIPLGTLGVVFFVIWWIVAFVLLKRLPYHSSKNFNDNP